MSGRAESRMPLRPLEAPVSERFPKVALLATAPLFVLLLAYLAYTRPGYFTNTTLLGGMIFLECLLAALWMYRRIFFVLVLLAFLFAGVDLPLGGMWTAARWFVLCAGALVGCFIMLKERHGRFSLFHALAVFAILAGLVSAAVSRYPGFAFLKAVSLLLLFLYAGTGARLAVAGRENRFFSGLLAGCEIFVGVIAAFYFFGVDVMGNPNSLGAVTAVLAPVLLWGTLIDQKPVVHYRRLLLFAICMYLLFHSHSRAGLVAAFVSCGLLCLALHKYKLFAQGIVILLILVTSAAIFDPEAFSRMVSSLTNSVVYKDRDMGSSVFASRQTPWQGAMDSIHKHFWFGSGFGTTDNGQDPTAYLGKFSTYIDATTENGSSYLTIVTWVGILGVLPFLLLLLALLGKILRTVLWMLNTGSPFHPAVPLAMIMIAGLIHAGFEDWLFAPGYYLCVFFWCLAFVFVDVTPWAPLPSFAVSWRPWLMRQGMSGAAPSR
jgi:O-antigen ligase